MAFKVRILPSAQAEVESIVAYLAGTGKGAAKCFVAQYRQQLEALASGAVVYGLSRMPELAALGYRACLFGSYVLLHYVDEYAIVVAHVFHQRQDYARLVLPEDLS